MTPAKESNLSKILLVILSAFLATGIAQIILTANLSAKQTEMDKRIQKINDDYTPLFVMEAIIQSNQLMASQIVGVKEGDEERVRQIQEQYFQLQRDVMAALARKRGGSSSISSSHGNSIK